MKNFLKTFLTKNNFLLILIFVLATFIRFYNFPNRVTFWSEQARSLIVSANYIKEKPSLLGQEYFRQDSNSHIIYSGALFNYSLIPLLIVSNYNPITITLFFAVLNLLTGIVVYWAVKRMFGNGPALISATLFLFNDFMIYHSLFIWNYNYLPLIGILIFYLTFKNLKKENWKYIFLLGLVSGVGISLQILFALIALSIFTINIWHSGRKIKYSVLFIFGMILGNLPLVIFDLRHNFYQLQTLLQYLIDTLLGKSGAGFAYYYLLPFWPVFATLGGIILWKVFRWKKLVGVLIIAAYLFLNITSQRISFWSPTGMPPGLKVSDIDYASKIVSNDATSDFNVAEVLDFDKRAYVLRYFLKFKYTKPPLPETDYPNIKLLYVLSQKGYNFAKSDTWEISSGGTYKVKELSNIGQGYAIYKLQK